MAPARGFDRLLVAGPGSSSDSWRRLGIGWPEEPRSISALPTLASTGRYIEPPAEHGPVLVTVEYRIDRVHAGDFVRAMREVRLERLRDGACAGAVHDPADPHRYVETFLVEFGSSTCASMSA